MLQDRLYDQIHFLHDMLNGTSDTKEKSTFDEAREKIRQELIDKFQLECSTMDQNELLMQQCQKIMHVQASYCSSS